MNITPLFSISFLASRWESEYQQFLNSPESAELLTRLKNWNNREILNETATEAALITLFFNELWGYRQQGNTTNDYQCYPQFPIKRAGQTGGTGRADLALGYFENSSVQNIPQVVCEFKDVRSGLDQKQNRKGNDRSPVRQCLDYLREAKNDLTGNELVEPVWGIVTDTNEFRLYNRLKGEAQSLCFVISSSDNKAESLLAETESAAFLRFLFFKVFHRHSLLAERGDSALTLLLKDHIIHESDLERDFYLEYKAYREHIFKALVAANPAFPGSKGKLVRLTQRFLDRCLFIMFCEDMGKALDFPCDLLRDVLIDISCDKYYNPDDSHAWDRIKSIFRVMRDGGTFGSHRINRFNGGLFEELSELENLNIPNKLFCSKNQGAGGTETHFAHPLTLLFFSAKYNFGIKGADHQRVIDFYALGRIFEQSITELEIMEAEADGRDSINLLSKRKRDGVYYTPEWVTAYIVEETVGARLMDIKQRLGLTDALRPTDEHLNEYRAFQKDKRKTAKVAGEWLKGLRDYRVHLNVLKIVDPACGSGAFLIQSLDQLKNEHRWVINETVRITGEPELWDSDSVINSILSNNLYGVDINAESVEIAKLALWMHTASPGKPLSSLDNNIQCGNSLVGMDFYDTQQKNLFSEDEQERINVFDWDKAFPEVFSHGGFDCVVGNPPYVKLQHFKKVQSSCADYLVNAKRSSGKPLYASAQTGNFDLYLLFIEKGVELLKPEGRMGYIAPSVWMMNEYGEGLRAFTKSRECLDRWVDFKSYQVFDEAITYTSLQFFKGQVTESVHCAFVPDGDLSVIDWQTPQTTIPYVELSESDAWNLMPTQERNLVERLKATCETLEQCSKGIFVGIQTSADNIYHLKRLSTGRYQTKTGIEVELEDAIMRPLVSGTEAKRYLTPETNTYLLFPYDLTGDRPQLFSESAMQLEFPLTFAYLKQHELSLRSRENSKMDIDGGWWAYNYPKNLDKQEFAKLIVAQTVPSMRVAYDKNGEFYCNNVRVNGILPKTDNDGWYLLGILNAPPANFVFVRIAKPKDGGWYEANKQFIAPLPIPAATPEEKADVANKAKELQLLHTHRRTLSCKFGQRWLCDQTETDKRKESWFCADAAKRAEKFEMWNTLLRPGSTLLVESSDDELRLKIGTTTVLELFDLPDTPYIAAQWRHILRTVNVTESFNAKKLVKLLLNLRKTSHNEIKERLVKLDEDIIKTELAIQLLEKNMNALVYRLYGLSDDEIRLVEAG